MSNMEKSIIQIDNWACVSDDPFAPPELRCLYLHGTIKGHPTRPDGQKVKTSNIVRSEGDLVFTKNSIYKLGQPDPKWLDWMEENGIQFDPENPIKIKIIAGLV